jgi:hypothetical protein
VLLGCLWRVGYPGVHGRVVKCVFFLWFFLFDLWYGLIFAWWGHGCIWMGVARFALHPDSGDRIHRQTNTMRLGNEWHFFARLICHC